MAETELQSCAYHIVRYAPNLVRDEWINIGVVLFDPASGRILRRLEFHFTPKHASWLNMVECEISVLQRQCLGRRIDDPKRLRSEIAAWQRRRNKTRTSIKWMFTTDKARAKMGRAYPATAKESKSL